MKTDAFILISPLAVKFSHLNATLRGSFPARTEESCFGGRISEKKDNMHSKAIKTKKQNHKQKFNNKKLLFADHVKSHNPPPP